MRMLSLRFVSNIIFFNDYKKINHTKKIRWPSGWPKSEQIYFYDDNRKFEQLIISLSFLSKFSNNCIRISENMLSSKKR